LIAILTIVGSIGQEVWKLRSPKNYKTKKQYEKAVRTYHAGIIEPYDPDSPGRMLKWWDAYVKKTLLTIFCVFFYEYPMVAVGAMVVLSIIDIYVCSGDLTGIFFVNTLIWIESAGFMIIFIGPG
jgi:hypothetical protein